jgi:hypothetical protein
MALTRFFVRTGPRKDLSPGWCVLLDADGLAGARCSSRRGLWVSRIGFGG